MPRVRVRCWRRSATPPGSPGWMRPRGRRRRRRSWQAVTRIRAALPADTALIGFAGSPWTVACYMVEGHGSKEFAVRPRPGLSRPGAVRRADRPAGGADQRLSAGAGRGGRRHGDAVRFLGRRAARRAVPPLRHRTDAAHRRGAAGGASGLPVIGFPRLAGALLGEYAAATGVQAVGIDTSTDPVWAASAVPRRLPCRATWIRWPWSPAARPAEAAGARAGGLARPARHLQPRPRHRAGDAARARDATDGGPSSCLTPPCAPAMRRCGAEDAPGRRPVQPRRPGQAGLGAAVPGQPVQRPGDPAGAVLRPPAAGPDHRLCPHQAGHRELPDPRRRLALAGADAGAGAGAGGGAAGIRREVLRGDALLAPVQRRGRPGGAGLAPGRGRVAAALPAILHHHHRVVADRLAGGRGPGEPGRPRDDAVLLPRRSRLRRRHRGGGAPGL